MLDKPVVQEGHTRLDGVGHAHDVGVAKELVAEIVIDLESRQGLAEATPGLESQDGARVAELAGLQPEEAARLGGGEEPSDQ